MAISDLAPMAGRSSAKIAMDASPSTQGSRAARSPTPRGRRRSGQPGSFGGSSLFWLPSCTTCPEDSLRLHDGSFLVDGDSSRAIPLRDLAAKAIASTQKPIAAETVYVCDPAEVTSFCAQVAEVQVDPETGQVRVTRIVTAHDVGTVLNPITHQGQIEGGVVHGLGYA